MKSIVLPSEASEVKSALHLALFPVLKFSGHDPVSHLLSDLPGGTGTKCRRNGSQIKTALPPRARGALE